MARVIRSSAAALATGYVLLAFAALVLFAAPLLYAWQETIKDFRFEILQEDSQRLTHVFQLRGPAGLKTFIDERVGMQIAGERMLLLSDAEGREVAGNLPAWPQSIPAHAGSYTLAVTLNGRRSRVAMVLATLPGGYRLLVGRDVDRFAPIEQRFWYGLAAAVAVLTVAGLIGAVLIRRALLARIQSTQQTVAAIMRGDLSHRLTVRSSGDELDTLAQTINRLLEQIEQLVHGIANVSNSIAHDLRTPLAELRSRLEELSLTRPPVEETFAEIDAAVTDVDGVIRIFNALLRLAEIDAGLRRSNFVATDLGELVAKAVEFYLPAAELKGLSLTLRDPGPAVARCDPVLLPGDQQSRRQLPEIRHGRRPHRARSRAPDRRPPRRRRRRRRPRHSGGGPAESGRALLPRRCESRNARGRTRAEPRRSHRQTPRRLARARRQSSRPPRPDDHRARHGVCGTAQ